MLKTAGFFNNFQNLDQIPADDIAKWLNFRVSAEQIENFVANRILYPQAVPVTQNDLEIESAILREYLKREFLKNDKSVFNEVGRRITIPDGFSQRITNLNKLGQIFIDAYLLSRKKLAVSEDIWVLSLSKENGEEILGSVVLPSLESDNADIEILFEGLAAKGLKEKRFFLKKGDLLIVPCSLGHCQFRFEGREGKILGRNEGVVEAYGGRLGVVFDGRSS